MRRLPSDPGRDSSTVCRRASFVAVAVTAAAAAVGLAAAELAAVAAVGAVRADAVGHAAAVAGGAAVAAAVGHAAVVGHVAAAAAAGRADVADSAAMPTTADDRHALHCCCRHRRRLRRGSIANTDCRCADPLMLVAHDAAAGRCHCR